MACEGGGAACLRLQGARPFFRLIGHVRNQSWVFNGVKMELLQYINKKTQRKVAAITVLHQFTVQRQHPGVAPCA